MLAPAETGQEFMTQKKESNILNNNYKELSIQVSLSGLSFCILNSATNQLEFLKNFTFDKLSSPITLQSKLEEFMASEKLEKFEIRKVIVLHQNELSVFVPKSLFSKNNLSDYLKYNVKILDNDFIAYDEIQNTDLINVYVPYANINNYIFDHFGEFEYKHFSSVLVETLLNKSQKNDEEIMYVNVSKNHFEVIVIKNRKLLFYNTFEYSSKEDFIYYILFSAEQLNLNPEKFLVFLLGDIEKDNELFEIIYTYIRNVEFGVNFNVFEAINEVSLPNKHEGLVLLNSFK